MRTPAARPWLLAAAIGLAPLAGCGQPEKPADQPTGPAAKDALADLGNLLKAAADEGKRPPARQADFAAYDATNPVAPAAVARQDVVYFWGAGYAAGGNKVVAHEKKTPAEGGLVLLQDGTVKEMTAAEFSAAPKAK